MTLRLLQQRAAAARARSAGLADALEQRRRQTAAAVHESRQRRARHDRQSWVEAHRLHRVAELLAAKVAAQSAPAPTWQLSPLSRRQLEVLQLLADGRSTQEIARQLWLSPNTVRNHVTALTRALDAHSRLEAVAIGRARQLIV